METSLHTNEVLTAGLPLDKASKALILVHGRGGTAADILQLRQHLLLKDFAVFAPQASQHSWYPYSFLAPPAQNEPWLTAAINSLARVVENVQQKIPADHIYLAGFSQGACLSLEFAARHAQRFGGVIAFTGGLIGDRIYPDNY
nr:alpha/beta fold hydrolase [Chitinophagaceae bacterium]